MKIYDKVFLVLSLSLVNSVGVAQQQEGDSLKHELEIATQDTMKAVILDKLAATLPDGEWEGYNEMLEALAIEKLKIAQGREKKIYQSCLASAYNNKSLIFKFAGDVPNAIAYGEKSLVLFEALDDKPNLSISTFNNGKLYYALGDINHAILSFQRGLKIAQAIDKKNLQTYCLNQLGFISKEQQELARAMEYHKAAYDLAKAMKDNELLAYTITCMGIVYFDEKKYSEALKSFTDALKIYEDREDVQNVAAQYYHIGMIYKEQKLFLEAQTNFMKALELNTKRDDKVSMSANVNAIGQNYLNQKKIKEAELYFTKGLELSNQLGFPHNIFTSAEGLYKVYKEKHDPGKALAMHELYVRMRDSVNNETVRKKVLKSQYKYEFEKKAEADSVIRTEERKVTTAQLSQERTQRYALWVASLLVLSIAGFVIYRLRINQRIKELHLRNRIASDLHDDVGSALSSISLFAGVARIHADRSQESIAHIEATSRETIENMSDIVWSIKPANDDFGNVIDKMKAFGENLCTSAGVAFTFSSDTDLLNLSMNMIQRKNIYLIYKEALNNALKYSGASAIDVSFVKDGRQITMLLRDNGKGFDLSNAANGNGIENMKRRSEEIKSAFTIDSNAGGTFVNLIVKMS